MGDPSLMEPALMETLYVICALPLTVFLVWLSYFTGVAVKGDGPPTRDNVSEPPVIVQQFALSILGAICLMCVAIPVGLVFKVAYSIISSLAP